LCIGKQDILKNVGGGKSKFKPARRSNTQGGGIDAHRKSVNRLKWSRGAPKKPLRKRGESEVGPPQSIEQGERGPDVIRIMAIGAVEGSSSVRAWLVE